MRPRCGRPAMPWTTAGRVCQGGFLVTSFSHLVIEHRAIGELVADPQNPRTHPAAQLAAIEASIERFGWTNPILVDGRGQVIAGEARLAAARRRRQKKVPVIVLGHLTGSERRAYQIADNRIPLGAGWNETLLAAAMADLVAAGIGAEITGFDDAELAELLAGILPDGELRDEDAVPLPAQETVTRLGDAWRMGPHRLVCGDSTQAATYEIFGAGGAKAVIADAVFTDPPYGMAYEGGRARADLVVTDPPYGMSFGAGKEAGSTKKGATVKAHGQILGDDFKGTALVDLVGGALIQAQLVARPDAAVYCCFTWRTYGEFIAALAAADLTPAACIVWDKGSIGLGHQHYRPRHEFLFYCAGGRWYGGKAEGDVWEFSRGHTESYVHPTQKPVGLIERAITNSSLPGEIVLDVFGGSGSTLIAAEKLRRTAWLVELDPKYCDVIVRRWQGYGGGTAVREGDGTAFDEIAGHGG